MTDEMREKLRRAFMRGWSGAQGRYVNDRPEIQFDEWIAADLAPPAPSGQVTLRDVWWEPFMAGYRFRICDEDLQQNNPGEVNGSDMAIWHASTHGSRAKAARGRGSEMKRRSFSMMLSAEEARVIWCLLDGAADAGASNDGLTPEEGEIAVRASSAFYAFYRRNREGAAP